MMKLVIKGLTININLPASGDILMGVGGKCRVRWYEGNGEKCKRRDGVDFIGESRKSLLVFTPPSMSLRVKRKGR